MTHDDLRSHPRNEPMHQNHRQRLPAEKRGVSPRGGGHLVGQQTYDSTLSKRTVQRANPARVGRYERASRPGAAASNDRVETGDTHGLVERSQSVSLTQKKIQDLPI